MTSKSYLGGTLRTNLMDGFTPALGSAYQIITGSGFPAEGFFRYVTGTVLGSGNDKQMLKVDYRTEEVPLQLVMKGSEDVHFVGNGQSTQWDLNTNCSTGALPTEIDHVYLDDGVNVVHANGIDLVDQLSVLSGAGLNISGGLLGVNRVDLAGTIAINGGTLALNGVARLHSLELNSGMVTGTAASILNVTDNYVQGEGVIFSSGDVALSQSGGDLVVGDITARNLVLESQDQAIRQQGTGLHVTRQLIAAAVTGITLDNSGNRIAAFAANNRVSGDIMLVNHLESADASVVTLNGVTNGGLRAVTGLIGKRNHDAVSFDTPTATIGIRGTDFGALFCQNDCGGIPTTNGAAPANGLHVDVAQGAIVVANPAGSQVFQTNQFGFVANLNVPPMSVPVSQGIRVTMPPTISMNIPVSKSVDASKSMACMVQ